MIEWEYDPAGTVVPLHEALLAFKERVIKSSRNWLTVIAVWTAAPWGECEVKNCCEIKPKARKRHDN
jgi:hypothetical protein